MHFVLHEVARLVGEGVEVSGVDLLNKRGEVRTFVARGPPDVASSKTSAKVLDLGLQHVSIYYPIRKHSFSRGKVRVHPSLSGWNIFFSLRGCDLPIYLAPVQLSPQQHWVDHSQ